MGGDLSGYKEARARAAVLRVRELLDSLLEPADGGEPGGGGAGHDPVPHRAALHRGRAGRRFDQRVTARTRGDYLQWLYSLGGQAAIVTGGTGVLGRTMATALAMAGAKVAILGRRSAAAAEVAAEIQAQGGEALAVTGNVLDRDSLVAARERVMAEWGAVHVLVNAAGGNTAAATVGETADLFTMSASAFKEVVDLNLTGTLLPSLVFGEAIVESGGGSIVNVSSMSASRALTRVAGYGAAKAAGEKLTRSLAVELGPRHGGSIRLHAL